MCNERIYPICQNCGKSDNTVKERRDPEEGHNGPTYDWCSNCKSIIDERFCDSMDDDEYYY